MTVIRKYNKNILNNYVSNLKYGTIAINEWSAIGFIIPSLPWGGYPGNKDNDIQSESVGFFKFTNKLSAKLLFEAKKMMLKNPNYMYEDVIQKMIKEKKIKLDFENITNLPWIEIDYKKDLKKARKNILKKIND